MTIPNNVTQDKRTATSSKPPPQKKNYVNTLTEG